MAAIESEITWERVHISQLQTSLNHYQYARLTKDVEHIILEKIPIINGQIPEIKKIVGTVVTSDFPVRKKYY